MHRYTQDQVYFLTKNVKGRSTAELTKLFNKHFGLELKDSQIRSLKKRQGLTSGIDGRFKPGNVPFNKGKEGIGGWEPTQFKKGHKPHNYMPVGSERVSGDGYVDVKVSDPNKWRAKHLLVWEKENGPVPKGQVVIFGDGNRRNFELDNLILVSRKQLAILNQNNLIQDDAELTRTGLIVADIIGKIGERKKANERKRG
jgi:hypothetical protein